MRSDLDRREHCAGFAAAANTTIAGKWRRPALVYSTRVLDAVKAFPHK